MKELGNLALDVYRACREMAVERYQYWALDRLKAHVPFDAALWASGYFGERGPEIHNVILVNRPFAMLADYETVKHADRLAYENAAKPGVACVANQLRDQPEWTPEITAYLAKWRINHAMSCHTVDPLTRLASAIALWREDAAVPFTEEQRRFFECAMPHLMETYATNRIVHMVRATQPRNAALYASAAADGLGRLHVAPANFQRLMLAEWPQWRGHQLPAALAHLVAHDAGSRYVGQQVFLRSAKVNDIFLLQAREKRDVDELTARELEIARLAASGLTYGGVAKRLAISPATVRSHLSATYDKLKVRKQAAIVSMLRDFE